MTTTNIPLTTLSAGVHNFPATGGASVADADSSITLSVDRTVANGLNSQPATTVLSIQSWQSNDGGSTWEQLAGATWPGGTYTGIHGTITEAHLVTNLAAATGRLVRAVVTVTGTSLAVAGSITTQ